MNKLKAGVIGLGMGWNHLADYMNNPDVEVVAIADRRPERRERAKEEFGLTNIYNEGIDMINSEKLDIVSVAVPNDQHNPLTIAALKSGAHVLCEKPMALNAAEAQEMMDVAKECHRKLGIDFSYRFYPQSRAMKELVESGALGNIYYARSEWFRRRGIPGLAADNFNTGSRGAMGSWFFDKKQSGGGPLIDLGVHRLDLALWMMGYPEPEWVMGSAYNTLGVELAGKCGQEYTVEDMACAMIKFKNGATLELDASWASNVKQNELMSTRLLGDKGGIFQYNLNEGYTYDIDYSYEFNGKQFDSKLHDPVPGVKSAYTMFAEAVLEDKPFLVQPEEGVTVMKLLDAIYESAKKGEPVKVG